MERHSVQAALPYPAHREAARPGVPAGLHRECPARPSAAVALRVRAQELALRLPAVARLTAEPGVVRRSGPAEPDAVAAPRREVQRASAAQRQAVRVE
jgi:hypothetical protein